MTNNKQTTGKSISERFIEVWGLLSHNQRRYVVAMQECTTKKEAAAAIDLEPDTIYRWPALVDEAVSLLNGNVRESAVQMLTHSLTKAAMVKITGMDSDDEKIRQGAASEILDRVLGKAVQPIEDITDHKAFILALCALRDKGSLTPEISIQQFGLDATEEVWPGTKQKVVITENEYSDVTS